ncbi:MAG: substrate-binding domain-containing protein, partial [Planctomycetota bacterium]
GREETAPDELVETTRSNGALGVILDSFDRRLLETLHSAGVPAVVVDSLSVEVEADLVMQDGEMGAMRAAEHLAAEGLRRIGWVGPELREGSPQIADRFAGAVAGLARRGLALSEKLRATISLVDHDQARRAARALLSRKDRPDAILALWQRSVQAVVEASRELGLKPGEDFAMVGWSTKKYYFDRYVPLFTGGPVPPAVVWSLMDMARAAVRVLNMRRGHPRMSPVQMRIPARLWFHGTPPAV